MPWFILPSGSTATNPVNYIPVGVMPLCSGTNRVCAIDAAMSGGYPIFSNGLKDEIINALNSRTNSPTVLLKS